MGWGGLRCFIPPSSSSSSSSHPPLLINLVLFYFFPSSLGFAGCWGGGLGALGGGFGGCGGVVLGWGWGFWGQGGVFRGRVTRRDGFGVREDGFGVGEIETLRFPAGRPVRSVVQPPPGAVPELLGGQNLDFFGVVWAFLVVVLLEVPSRAGLASAEPSAASLVPANLWGCWTLLAAIQVKIQAPGDNTQLPARTQRPKTQI